MIKQKISAWGNSLGIRLPQTLLGQTDFQEGDEVIVTVEAGKIILSSIKPTFTLEELLDGCSSEMQHEEIDWGNSVGAEIW